MRILAASLPVLALAALPAAHSAATDGPQIEKGRDIRPLLEQNARLQAEAIRGESRKAELRKTAYLALRLDEPGEECVARDPRAGACLVSVEDFNERLETWDFAAQDRDSGIPSDEDAERERSALLRSLLEEKYLEAVSPDGPVGDSLRRLLDSTRNESIQAFRARRGDSAFRAAYRSHFARLFQGKEKRRYQALAASDSALADSLYLETTKLREGPGSARRSLPSPPWRRLEEEELPPELLPSVAGLRPGETAGPIKTPYGRVYLRLHSVHRTPDLGFEEAMPILISLLHAPAGQDRRLDAAVDAHYARNPADFKAPDTVLYRAWLLPEAGRRGRSGLKERIREDTAEAASIAVQDTLLPRALREELDLYRPVRPGGLLGPIRSLFGTWYFRPLEIRKGSRGLTLAEARPRIRESLFGRTPPSPEISALREAEAKDRDLWKGLVSDYLSKKAREGLEPGAASPGAGDPASSASVAETYRRLERDKEEWMRGRLQIRFVEWAGHGPVGEAGRGTEGDPGPR